MKCKRCDKVSSSLFSIDTFGMIKVCSKCLEKSNSTPTGIYHDRDANNAVISD